MLRNILLLFLGAFSLTASLGFGQDPVFRQITTSNGLPSNEVYSMVQDQEGFIWIGCDAGLFRFNGFTFKKITSSSQSSRAISGLVVSSSGNIFCNTFTGQVLYTSHDTLIPLNAWKGKVAGIVPGVADQIWITGDSGLAVFHEHSNTFIQVEEPLPDATHGFATGCAFHDSALYYKTAHDMWRYNGSNAYKLSTKLPASANLGEYIIGVGAACHWLFPRYGNAPLHLEGSTFSHVKSPFLKWCLEGRKVNMVRTSDDGSLWICTYSGLIRYSPETDTGEILFADLSVSDVLFDREGMIWVSTLQSGLVIIPDQEYREWRETGQEGSLTGIRQLTITKDAVFYASADGCVRKLDFQTGERSKYCLPVRTDFSALQSTMGSHRVWFSASNQVYTLNGGQIVQLSGVIPPVKDLLVLQEAVLFATSFGIFVQEGTQNIRQPVRITDTWTRQFYLSVTGEVLAATDKGILRHSPEHHLTAGWELLSGWDGQVLGISGNPEGDSVFALTFDGKILSRNVGGFLLLTRLPEGFAAQDVRYWNESVWVATHAGLLRFDLHQQQWSLHRAGSGLAETDIRKFIPYDGHFWLATSNGLRCIPTAPEVTQVFPHLYLRQVLIDTVMSTSWENIRLKAGQSLTLYPEAAFYRFGQGFRYGYRILEQDTNWISTPGSLEEIRIRSMPAGNFTLELCILSRTGNPLGKRIFVTGFAAPPFWQRWWFYLLIGILTTGITAGIAWIRITSERIHQQRELKRMILENEVRLSQQTALTAQMNPHFLFNVLNSIKAYMYSNDRRQAARYLDEFSALVRQTLEMSKHPIVPLRDEIATLEIYIGLEAMMIEGGVDCNLQIGPEVDTSGVQIPPLLLQPFVENAFKHGLMHKKGRKSLNIRLQQADNTLRISIEDNGIGRAAAAELNRNRHGHLSFATSSANHRIDLLNAANPNSASIEIIDLHNENGEATGTSVTITLRYS